MSALQLITGEPGAGPCKGCGQVRETRMGFCFDCATSGERRAANRSVEEHLRKALENMSAGRAENARFDVQWALERLTETGDYARGGTFDRDYPEWRDPVEAGRQMLQASVDDLQPKDNGNG